MGKQAGLDCFYQDNSEGCSGLMTSLGPVWGKFESFESKETAAVTGSFHGYGGRQISKKDDNNYNNNTTHH